MTQKIKAETYRNSATPVTTTIIEHSPYTKFENMARALVSVPKSEIDERQAEDRPVRSS